MQGINNVKSECQWFHLVVCCLGRVLATFRLIMSAIQTVLSDVTREVWLLHSFVVGRVCTSVRVSPAMFTYLISEINEGIYT